MYLRRFWSLGFPFYGWTKPDAESSRWLLVTVVIHLLFSLSQRKFVETDIFLYISLSQLRYPEGHIQVCFSSCDDCKCWDRSFCQNVQWNFLAFTAVLGKVFDHEIHCIRWGTEKPLQGVPSVVHSQIICPSVCSIYSIESPLLGYILFTLLQILLCICSLCVCTWAQTHTLVYIFNIYFLTFFWERAKEFFLP